MLYMLRRLERWLHQHIFKVGWLVTKKLQTTTILYYAFFLPGIFVHEFTYWLVAGLLNVRADRALEWPKKQEVGELKLNFVKVSPKTSPIKLAIITASPFVSGILLVWFIANSVLDIQAFTATIESGFLGDVSTAVSRLTAVPDFWLWIYLLFTISNTLMPGRPEHLRGWRVILVALGIILAVLFLLGAADDVLANAFGSLNNSVNILSGALAVIIGLDLFMVGVLGLIEAVIERITGDSATFKDGKMITMRREELLAQRAVQFSQARQRTSAKPGRTTTPAGPPSIYKLPLPIPGAPGKEAVTREESQIITPEARPLPSPLSATPGRSAPGVITVGDSPTLPEKGRIEPPEDDDLDYEDVDDLA